MSATCTAYELPEVVGDTQAVAQPLTGEADLPQARRMAARGRRSGSRRQVRPRYAYPLLAGAVLVVGVLGNAALAMRSADAAARDEQLVFAADPPAARGLARSGLTMPAAPLHFATIQNAVRSHAQAVAQGGLTEARRTSAACHDRAEAQPSWDGLDFCAAFDLAAQSQAPRDPYFAFQVESGMDAYAPLQFAAASRIARIEAAVRNIAAAEARQGKGN